MPRLSIIATRHQLLGHHNQCRQFHHSTGFHFQKPLHSIIVDNAPLIDQKRYYQINLAHTGTGENDAYNNQTSSTPSINNDIDEETLAIQNKLSRRLYRTLLRSCKTGIIHANKNNSIDCSSGNVKGLDEWILLQPKMDQRKYGFAKFLEARRGATTHYPRVKSSHGVPTNDCLNTKKKLANKAISKMSNEEIGMAMEVLNFVHVSLGGNRYDNLEEYYLGRSTSENDSSLISDHDSDASSDEEDADRESIAEDSSSAVERVSGASSGKHSEGHYTQFIDDDSERGEGEEEKGHNRKVAANADGDDKSEDDNDEYHDVDIEWDSDDYDSDYNCNNIDHFEPDDSVLVTANDLQNAIRIAFQAPLHLPQDDDNNDEEDQTTSSIISRRHRDAIDASLQLSQQIHRWKDKSSISIDWEHGVRVVVTSSLMMRSNNGISKKNRFAYKIRVENIVDIIDEMKKKKSGSRRGSGSDESGPVDDEDDKKSSLGDDVGHRAVQLLGRSWAISERGPWKKTSFSLLQKLLEDGVVLNTNNGSSSVAGKEADGDDNDDDNELRVVQTLNEPTTGAGKYLTLCSSTIPLSCITYINIL